jgi:large subunit ribosomal protein L24e
MKRNPRKVGWTKAYRKAAGKEMQGESLPNLPYQIPWLTPPSRHDAPVRRPPQRPRPLRPGPRAEDAARHVPRVGDPVPPRARLLQEAHGRQPGACPRRRGSEKRALLEQGATEEEIAETEREQALVGKRRTAVFGEEKIRRRITVDGDVVEEREEAGGMTFEDDADDNDGDDDDEMDMD